MDINDQLNKGGKHRHMSSTIITREREREIIKNITDYTNFRCKNYY